MLDIKINEFEGPLDLLLYLVENKKMNILNINISELIDEYISIIEKQKEDKFKLKVEFLQMATQLLEIKAFSVLRKDEQNISATDLEKRLIEYKVIKEISKKLKENENEYYVSYKKHGNYDYENEKIEHDNTNLNMDSIQEVLLKLFNKYNKKENKIVIDVENNFSVDDAKDLIKSIKTNEYVSFSSLLKGKFTKNRIVSFFLAILDEYKQSNINIEIIEEQLYIKKENKDV